jgi:hypothetical protein
MTIIRLLLGLAATLALAAPTASASSKHHRYVHPHPPAVARNVPGAGPSFAPPQIFEARPGVFISTYGCITDEGYGRWTYCGQGRGGG